MPRRGPRRRKPQNVRRAPKINLYGKVLRVTPNPPPIRSLAPLVTTVDTSFNVPVNQFYNVNVTLIESLLETQFGIMPASYTISVDWMKVWLLVTEQKLTVQFFDVNSSAGAPSQQEVTDWGAPTRYAAVGFAYAVASRTTTVSGGSGAGLAAISHSGGSPARTLVRFGIRLKFKSLSGSV